MSVIIPKASTFLGVPLVKVRNVLKAWRHGNRDDLWHIAERKDLALDPRIVMILVEELRERGLIGPEEQEHGPPEDGLTEAGLALAGADARRRTPKAQAQKILDRFLDACAAVNLRSDLPFKVPEVWLFGSMIDATKPDVGDVDLVVEFDLAEGYDRASALKHYRKLAQAMGATPQSGLMAVFGDEAFVQRQLLHGGRRHPLLAIARPDELRDMACQCRLVFDVSRGGLVSDPVVDRHPSSNGRSDRIGEKRRMPDLAGLRRPLRPVFAGLMQSRYIRYPMMKAIGPWDQDDPAYALMDRGARLPVIVADGVVRPLLKPNALMKRMRFLGCDGRERSGFIFTETVWVDPDDWRLGHEQVPLAAIVVERSIQQDRASVAYRLDLVDADHLGRTFKYGHLLMIEWWLHLLITTDVERIVRREIENGVNYDVTVQISNSADKRIAAGLAYAPQLFDRSYVAETRMRLGSR